MVSGGRGSPTTSTTPADLPIELTDRRELHVNLETAGQLGIAIPQSLLLQADRVFQ